MSKILKTLSLATLVSAFVMMTGCSTTDATTSGSSSTIIMVGYMLLIFGTLYMFMIRPEKKRKKKLEEMRDTLSVGDQVTTIGGIVGKIVHIKSDFVVMETSEDRVRIEIAKWAIGTSGKASEQE